MTQPTQTAQILYESMCKSPFSGVICHIRNLISQTSLSVKIRGKAHEQERRTKENYQLIFRKVSFTTSTWFSTVFTLRQSSQFLFYDQIKILISRILPCFIAHVVDVG